MNENQDVDIVIDRPAPTPYTPPTAGAESGKGPSHKQSKVAEVMREIIIFIIIAFGIVLPFRMFVAEPYIVSGSSMDPTFATGHYLIVDKLSYEHGDPERNSVVIFKFPENSKFTAEEGKNLIKRVIGLPGDTVTMSGDTVTITNTANPKGFVLDQSYLAHQMPANFTVTLKADEYFVMGDNRPASFDSRSWGVLPRADIIGRPVLRLWPLSEIGILPGDHTSKN